MGRAKGRRPQKPKVADMPFDWTDSLINEVMESTNSTSACATVDAGLATVDVISEMKVSQHRGGQVVTW